MPADLGADGTSSQTRVARRRWTPVLVGVAALPAGAALVVTVTGKLVRWTWRGDLVAICLPLLAAAAAAACVASMLLRWRWAVVATAAVVMGSTWTIVAPRLPLSSGAPAEPLRIAAVNVRFDNGRWDEGITDVLAQHPAVVVVSELTTRTDRLLAAVYPYRAVAWGVSYGEGVYSRVPMEAKPPPTGLGAQVVKVRFGSPTPFVLYAIHLPRPQINWDGHPNSTSFGARRAELRDLDRQLRGEGVPAVVAGDLNLSDRAAGYGLLTSGRLDAGRVGTWSGTTYVGTTAWSSLQLRIDYVLVPGEWCAAAARSFDITGSDHRGVAADVGTCPSHS